MCKSAKNSWVELSCAVDRDVCFTVERIQMNEYRIAWQIQSERLSFLATVNCDIGVRDVWKYRTKLLERFVQFLCLNTHTSIHMHKLSLLNTTAINTIGILWFHIQNLVIQIHQRQSKSTMMTIDQEHLPNSRNVCHNFRSHYLPFQLRKLQANLLFELWIENKTPH